jgi:hypothetical protein
MARDPDIAARLEEALAAAARCTDGESARDYEILDEELQGLRSAATHACRTHANCALLIENLRAGQPLSPEEVATLRLLLVGDAEYFVKYDEEFQRCKTDLGRILSELKGFQSDAELDLDKLMHLSVLCQEAGNLLAMTRHYLEQRDRIRNFEEATSGPIDKATGQSLVNVIREMMQE